MKGQSSITQHLPFLRDCKVTYNSNLELKSAMCDKCPLNEIKTKFKHKFQSVFFKRKFNVQQSPRLSFNLREGLPSLFGLDERQGDGSGFKGVNALSPGCIYSTLGETGLFKTLADTGLLVGIGMTWERFSLTVESKCFCCSGYCTGGSHIFDVHRSTRLN